MSNLASDHPPGYIVALTCPACAGEVEHQTTGRVLNGTYATSVTRCVECGRPWQVIVTVRRAPR